MFCNLIAKKKLLLRLILLSSWLTFSLAGVNITAPEDDAKPRASDRGEKTSTRPTGAIVGGVIGGVALLVLMTGCLAVWWRRRKQRNQEGDRIKIIARDHEMGSRGNMPVSLLVSADEADPEHGPNIVHPFDVNSAGRCPSLTREEDRIPSSSVSNSAAPVRLPSTKLTLSNSEADTGSMYSPQTLRPESANEQAMKEQMAALYNEVIRLRQLVPGGGLDCEELPPSYDTDALSQERDRLMNTRNDLLQKTS